MDLHDLARSARVPTVQQALARIAADTLVLGVEEDALIPVAEQVAVARGIVAAGGHAELKIVSSELGTDRVESRLVHSIDQGLGCMPRRLWMHG